MPITDLRPTNAYGQKTTFNKTAFFKHVMNTAYDTNGDKTLSTQEKEVMQEEEKAARKKLEEMGIDKKYWDQATDILLKKVDFSKGKFFKYSDVLKLAEELSNKAVFNKLTEKLAQFGNPDPAYFFN